MQKVEVVSCNNVKGQNDNGAYDFHTCDLILTDDKGQRIVGNWMMPKGAKAIAPGFYTPQFECVSYSGKIKANITGLVPIKA